MPFDPSFTFQMPTLWAVMIGESVAYCASGVKGRVKDVSEAE
jgi:hypothetical protein